MRKTLEEKIEDKKQKLQFLKYFYEYNQGKLRSQTPDPFSKETEEQKIEKQYQKVVKKRKKLKSLSPRMKNYSKYSKVHRGQDLGHHITKEHQIRPKIKHFFKTYINPALLKDNRKHPIKIKKKSFKQKLIDLSKKTYYQNRFGS